MLARTVALASDPEGHKQTLEQHAAKAEAELQVLRDEWETHRAPLAEAIAAHEASVAGRKQEARSSMGSARGTRRGSSRAPPMMTERRRRRDPRSLCMGSWDVSPTAKV